MSTVRYHKLVRDRIPQIIEQDGRKYLLEKPLRADVALVYAGKADRFGNLFLDGTTRNYNPVMATAAEIVIADLAASRCRQELFRTALGVSD